LDDFEGVAGLFGCGLTGFSISYGYFAVFGCYGCFGVESYE
jgi:hypothetical protein